MSLNKYTAMKSSLMKEVWRERKYSFPLHLKENIDDITGLCEKVTPRFYHYYRKKNAADEMLLFCFF